MWKGKKAWIWTARVREVERGKSRTERRKCYGGEAGGVLPSVWSEGVCREHCSKDIVTGEEGRYWGGG